MPAEPHQKRVIAFVDGQNLFFNAKQAFAHHYPNYDIKKLSDSIAAQQTNWTVVEARFYTGVPDAINDPLWNFFWNAKLASMGRAGVHTFHRPLKYQMREIQLPDGSIQQVTVPQEKGIDVRLALDIVRLALDNRYDIALIFSQDQDLSEVADEIRTISASTNRWIKVVSAFPCSSSSRNKRGINKTEWIKIDQAQYDACLDPRDYRPKKKATSGIKHSP